MNLKEIKQRIHSVKSTQKITSAMKLVAAAKLRRTQTSIEHLRPYEQKLDSILSSFLCNTPVSSGYTLSREVKKVVIIPVASDTTFCGAFNSNIIRLAKEVIAEYSSKGVETEVLPIGKKMQEAIAKQGISTIEVLMQHAGNPQYSGISYVAKELMQRFLANEIDKIELVYTHFVSAGKQIPQRETLLPVDISSLSSDSVCHNIDYIIEPSKEDIVNSLIPNVITLRLYAALLDSAVAEHAARMVAMQVATDNANDLIGELTLEYNKCRQQAITNELLDIVSGS
jgi:F-type H+-transporting ATPase subunit gamma